MKFSQRLAYYLLGLLIGGMFLYYFLDAKDTRFCYLPNCRVLKELRSKPLHFTNEAEENMNTFTIDDIKKSLTYGDVDFSKSNVSKGNGKLYIIEGKDQNMKDITIYMVNYSDKVILEKVEYTKK